MKRRIRAGEVDVDDDVRTVLVKAYLFRKEMGYEEVAGQAVNFQGTDDVSVLNPAEEVLCRFDKTQLEVDSSANAT